MYSHHPKTMVKRKRVDSHLYAIPHFHVESMWDSYQSVPLSKRVANPKPWAHHPFAAPWAHNFSGTPLVAPLHKPYGSTLVLWSMFTHQNWFSNANFFPTLHKITKLNIPFHIFTCSSEESLYFYSLLEQHKQEMVSVSQNPNPNTKRNILSFDQV